MKERPIIFSGPMVRAILDGRKTQTRRVVRPQPVGGPDLHLSGWDWSEGMCVFADGSRPIREIRCPYGAPGDTLWVRETWGLPPCYDPKKHGDLRSRPRIMLIVYGESYGGWEGAPRQAWDGMRWRPSIHMPRWASRLTLLVKSVRVERLQEISEEDAMAEGIERISGMRYLDEKCRNGGLPNSIKALGPYARRFRDAWDAINGKRAPWASNPWVWRVEFEENK